jgi:hypothetical protein
MTVKLHINALQGLFDIEGPEDFVERIYRDAKDSGLFSTPQFKETMEKSAEANPDIDVASQSTDQKKRKRTSPKKTGPACTERIIEMRQAGFFDQLKKASDVKDGLEKNGHSYAGNQVGAALTSLYRSGQLRRSKIENVWQYQKP